MMLYPATFAFQYPRLLPPNAKLIGPVLPEPAKPIADPELKAFIDKAKNGFVLVRARPLAVITYSATDIKQRRKLLY